MGPCGWSSGKSALGFSQIPNLEAKLEFMDPSEFLGQESPRERYTGLGEVDDQRLLGKPLSGLEAESSGSQTYPGEAPFLVASWCWGGEQPVPLVPREDEPRWC